MALRIAVFMAHCWGLLEACFEFDRVKHPSSFGWEIKSILGGYKVVFGWMELEWNDVGIIILIL